MKLQKLMIVLLVIAFAGTASAATDAVTGAIDVMTHAAAGDLDTSFGANGTVSTPLGSNLYGFPNGLCAQPDGKIVVVGDAQPIMGGGEMYFALLRYNPDGSLDTGFASAAGGAVQDVPSAPGIVITNFTPWNYASASTSKCAVGPNGEIVAVGNSEGESGEKEFAIARYLSNGNRDMNFLGTGLLSFPSSENNFWAEDVAITPDGKTWLVGRAEIMEGGIAHKHIVGARFAAVTGRSAEISGVLESVFLSNIGGLANAVVVQGDGKIITGGSSAGGKFLLARYIEACSIERGCLDGSFSGDGVVVSNVAGGITETVFALALQDNGEIVAAGSSGQGEIHKFVIRRYSAEGVEDTAFGSRYIDFPGLTQSFLRDMALYNGKIIVSGEGCLAPPRRECQTVIASLNSDGSLDESFGTGGRIVSPYPKGSVGLTIQADGKIVVAGPNGETPAGFGLARIFGLHQPTADLSISMAEDSRFGSNGLNYRITVSAEGPDEAESVVVRIALPDVVTLHSTNIPAICTGTTELTCSLGRMGSRQVESRLIVSVFGSTESDMTYTASVTSSTADPVPENNTTQLVTAKLTTGGGGEGGSGGGGGGGEVAGGGAGDASGDGSGSGPDLGGSSAGSSGGGCTLVAGAQNTSAACVLSFIFWAIITAPVVGVRIWKGREP